MHGFLRNFDIFDHFKHPYLLQLWGDIPVDFVALLQQGISGKLCHGDDSTGDSEFSSEEFSLGGKKS